MTGSITARQWLTLLTVQFTTVLFGLTSTSVTVILPQLKGALSASPDQASWILTFNLVATAVATPLTGWLAGKLGWRRLMLLSVSGFTLASVLCGTVDSLEAMLALRVLQGALGAPIFPMGQTILLAGFPRSQHPFIIMMWGVGGVMGPILGPTFGGLITDLLSWRWMFFLILPLGAVAATAVAASLTDNEKGTQPRFDYTGYVFISITIAATQLMLDRGQRNDWFDSPETIAECVLALLFLQMFVIHMVTSPAPIFRAATFADRNFAVGVIMALVMGMQQYGPMLLFPPLLQELRGYPERIIGFLIATRGLGNFLSFFIVAQFTRYNARLCLCTGLAIQAFAAVWMGSLDINMTTRDVLWTNMLHGFGFGLSYTPMAILAFSTLPGHLLTQGNAIFSLLRMIGSSLFISVILLVFTYSTAEASAHLSSLLSIFRLDAINPWIAIYGVASEAGPYDRVAAEVLRQSSMIGYLNAFHLMTILPLIAAPLAFLFAARRRD